MLDDSMIEQARALRASNNISEAEAICHHILLIYPRSFKALSLLGTLCFMSDRIEEGFKHLLLAEEIQPDYSVALYNLGLAYKRSQHYVKAEHYYRLYIFHNPEDALAWYELGSVLKDRLSEAENCYRRALEIMPDYAQAHNNLGVILNKLGRPKEAEVSYRCALNIMPDYAQAHNNLGNTLDDLGYPKEAEASYLRALEIMPNYAEAHINLGTTLINLGRLKEAEVSYRRALEIMPDYAEAHNSLGNILKDMGHLKEAETSYRRALEIMPDYAEAHSNLLFTQTYSASHHPSHYLEEACRFGQMVTRKARTPFSEWLCAPDPVRLRVGLVSGDLRNHPVGFFLESVLTQIDYSRVEFIAYSTNGKKDELTTRLTPYFSNWKSLMGLNDEDAARLIYSDGVNVLLDLAGHTGHNRLPVFAWKPAPVQATCLGYLASTGVAEIDYLLGDFQATPPEDSVHFSEAVWRMPEVWACLAPPDVEVDVGPLPALSKGCITFGCFNNLTKLNDGVVTLWSKVLHAVPSSQLFLKTRQLIDPSVCDTICQSFAANGITSDRLLLEGSSPRSGLLKAYNRVDIALDPFPYGGGTTTYEALWMAVPVIVRKGDRFLSRCGESIALNAGLADWIAEDNDDYVAKAVMHTQDLQRLATLRAGLRKQILSSPLFDSARYARNIEDALWGMWRNTK